MSKTKTVLFILAGTLVHFGLMFALVLQRISCDIQPNCVSTTNKVGVAILGFPMNVVMWVLYPHGARADGWFYIFALVNSLVAVTIIWFVFVRLIFGRVKRAS